MEEEEEEEEGEDFEDNTGIARLPRFLAPVPR